MSRRTWRTRRARQMCTAAAVLLAAAVSGCTGGSDPAPTASGDQDASACGGRVATQTLTTLFPGFDTATGSLATADWASGRCIVPATDGSALVNVNVQLLANPGLLGQFLDQARTASSAEPGPAELGQSVLTQSERQAAVSLVVGAYWVVVEVPGTPAAGTKKDAAVTVAKDVVQYYTDHPAPATATPAPAPTS